MTEPVVIVGAGPAGLTCAIQLSRYGMQPVLLEAKQPGGLLHNANWVENYPGFPDGISGPALVDLFTRQAANTGVVIRTERVISITSTDTGFQVNTPSQEYSTGVVVIAAGTQPKALPEIVQIPEINGKVFTEVYPLVGERDQRFAIVGAGDAAFDYALNLSQHNQVKILNRGTERRCLPLLWQRTAGHPAIDYRESTEVVGVKQNPDGGLELACKGPGGRVKIRADYLIYAIGRKPNLDFLSDDHIHQMDEYEKNGKLYFIGDVCNDIYRQTSIAVGDGMRAAMKIYQTFEEQTR